MNKPVQIVPSDADDKPPKASFFQENLRPKDAAAYLSISLSRLAKLRMEGQRKNGPVFIKVAGCVIYRKRDLEKWIDQNIVENVYEV